MSVMLKRRLKINICFLMKLQRQFRKINTDQSTKVTEEWNNLIVLRNVKINVMMSFLMSSISPTSLLHLSY